MTEAQRAIDSAIQEVERLRKVLRRGTAAQVQSADERQIIKATAHTWFNNHRKNALSALADDQLKGLDDGYRNLLAASGRAITRSKYLDLLNQIKRLLTQLQAEHVVELAGQPTKSQRPTTDLPPSFTALVTDAKMQAILANRWSECVKCVEASAPLAATVMMGGLLEGLLLAKINQLTNKAPVFTATSAPKDKNGTTLKLNEWGLKNYIDVAHELGWISQTTKDIGEVVRDYRNYIHPQREHSHGITLSSDDARMLWEVAKSVVRQVLKP